MRSDFSAALEATRQLYCRMLAKSKKEIAEILWKNCIHFRDPTNLMGPTREHLCRPPD